MRGFPVLAAFFLLTLAPALAGHSPPKVLLRVHVQTSGEGQSSMEATSINLPPQGEEIKIRAMPELTEEELIGAVPDADGKVHLLFDHAGQVALSAVTGEDQGRILVVFIDGYIVYAPIIDEQITTGQLILPKPLNPTILQQLQDVAQHNVREAAKT
jgi:preprotein translocase subunit SecD